MTTDTDDYTRRIMAFHWRDVPKGFYALPICETDEPYQLLGHKLFERTGVRTYKSGRTVGGDNWRRSYVLAPGTTPSREAFRRPYTDVPRTAGVAGTDSHQRNDKTRGFNDATRRRRLAGRGTPASRPGHPATSPPGLRRADGRPRRRPPRRRGPAAARGAGTARELS